MAEEREYFKRDSGSGSGNTFTKKLGPLPLWAWMGIGLALALGYYFIRQNLGSKSTANNGNAAPATASSSTEEDSTPANDIPQFVNQTYVEPPTVNTTVNNTLPSTPAPKPTGPPSTQEQGGPISGTTAQGPKTMHQITIAQAKYLLSKHNYPYYLDKTKNEFMRTANIHSGGTYYAGPMDWKDYLKNGKVKG